MERLTERDGNGIPIYKINTCEDISGKNEEKEINIIKKCCEYEDIEEKLEKKYGAKCDFSMIVDSLVSVVKEKQHDMEKFAILTNETYDKWNAYKKTGMEPEEIESMKNNDGWIPVNKILPEENQKIWVSVKYKGGDLESVEATFRNGEFVRVSTGTSLNIIAEAWMPRYVPDPYKLQN